MPGTGKTRKRMEKSVKSDSTPAVRDWQYWRVESSISCNLNCDMCPWERDLRSGTGSGIMSREIWRAIEPCLGRIESIEFSGGGQGGYNEYLPLWISGAVSAGCRTGLLTRGELLTTDNITSMINAGIDWVTIPVDGATQHLYERFVKGVRYNKLLENIRNFVEKKQGGLPLVNINYIVSSENIYQLPEIARLFSFIGVDRLNFRHCDEIRYDRKKRTGLTFAGNRKLVNYYEKEMAQALKIARKMKLQVSLFSLRPEEMPVCTRDPRGSLFIRTDGVVAPCINTAYGGRTAFLGKEDFIPTVHYGNIMDMSIEDIWQSEKSLYMRGVFEEREKSYTEAMYRMDSQASILRFKGAMKDALNRIPPAPEWCQSCHSLYGI